MASGIYVPMAGAVAQSQGLDIVANNLANVSTAGFRAERPSFAAVLGKTNAQDQRYAVIGKSGSDLTPGTMSETENPLDVAIEGDGLFAVQTPAGKRYTRDGQFRLDDAGRLTTKEGFAVLNDQDSPIVIGKSSAQVEIEERGEILIDGKQVGSLAIARFAPTALQREGKNLFSATGAALPDDKNIKVISGAIEQSNVNPVRGIVEMIRVSRTYEALHRMIESNKEIDERTARGFGNG